MSRISFNANKRGKRATAGDAPDFNEPSNRNDAFLAESEVCAAAQVICWLSESNSDIRSNDRADQG